ncbi:uncharacterized protein STEHIDRAFT_45272, partial [Stereum hirsutum FP-91666 SS1]|uniref:uncharacterized protein n=1 Tax=Stereum hirsutum (strain FP-91666) TaxID=721885 RepID=UPI000440CE13
DQAGTAFAATCGQQMYSIVTSDPYGNIQSEEQNIGSDTTDSCELYLCKGYVYDDNTANVQSYTAGQTVDFTIDIRAPHTGVANVSVVNTQTNEIIGDVLWTDTDAYSTSHTIGANETSFSVTLPDVGSSCTEAGTCVLQWWWDARSIDQTYMSCVDFTVDGSGSSSGSSSAASSSVAASTSAVAS